MNLRADRRPSDTCRLIRALENVSPENRIEVEGIPAELYELRRSVLEHSMRTSDAVSLRFEENNVRRVPCS